MSRLDMLHLLTETADFVQTMFGRDLWRPVGIFANTVLEV
jgi:hypothetical protein